MKTIKELGESDIGEAVKEYFERRGLLPVSFKLHVNQGDPGHPCDTGPSVSARAEVQQYNPQIRMRAALKYQGLAVVMLEAEHDDERGTERREELERLADEARALNEKVRARVEQDAGGQPAKEGSGGR
jgi:hypothetical protein